MKNNFLRVLFVVIFQVYLRYSRSVRVCVTGTSRQNRYFRFVLDIVWRWPTNVEIGHWWFNIKKLFEWMIVLLCLLLLCYIPVIFRLQFLLFIRLCCQLYKKGFKTVYTLFLFLLFFHGYTVYFWFYGWVWNPFL